MYDMTFVAFCQEPQKILEHEAELAVRNRRAAAYSREIANLRLYRKTMIFSMVLLAFTIIYTMI